jgi:hypothetical protein
MRFQLQTRPWLTMPEFAEAVLPQGGTPWHVLTCFDTLLYFDSEAREFRHGEVRSRPRNLFVVSSSNGAAIHVDGQLPRLSSAPLTGWRRRFPAWR